MAKVTKAKAKSKAKVQAKAKREPRVLTPEELALPTSKQVSDAKAVKIALARREGKEFRPLERTFKLRPAEGMNAYRCVNRGEKIMRSKAWREEQAAKEAEAAKAARAAEKRSEAARKAALEGAAQRKAKREAATQETPVNADVAAQELVHA